VSPRLRIPASTYRLQFNAGFTFRDALRIVPYLHQLGISDLYCSPIFKATPGSQHGYDISDPTRLNPELGTEKDFESLVAELRKRKMGLLLDIVPNHMATGADNPRWMDVLENGPASAYASFFDIEWQSTAGKPLDNKVLLPVLGRPYGEALEAGEIQIALEKDRLFVRYSDQRFPVAPATQGLVFGSPESPHRQDPAAEIARVNADVNELDRLLEAQFYRLAYWRLASEELNYRRFFDIGELVGVRVEEPEVFDTMHRLVQELVRRGQVSGLRIDHIDGLYDPVRYLERLETLNGSGGRYVVVEKILDSEERLPREMKAQGTTGYDFLNLVNSVFVDREGIEELRRIYGRFTGIDQEFGAIVYDRKRRAAARLFAGEVGRLSKRLAIIATRDRVARDIPLIMLVYSLIDITASLQVYRTYTNSTTVSERDRRHIDAAIKRARRLAGDERRMPAYSFLQKLLTLDTPPDESTAQEWLRFVMQWQQLTGPAMAKGFEDTALYVYHPLLSLNEVGGDPEFHAESTGLEALHRRNEEFLRRWPHSLNATTTHDTKRSEGARARLNVLSELPREWRGRLTRWRSFNSGLKTASGGALAPDPNEEILLYQTLLGSWPLQQSEVADFKKRFQGYVVKAAREAKTHTSWLEPNEDYEERLLRFSDAILKRSPRNRFLRDFLGFHAGIAFYGAINSVAQVVLKTTSPGVPDFYQGGELWDFSMVDPDNRRPIDFPKRAKLLERLMGSGIDYQSLLARWRDGRLKMFVTQRALHFRNTHHDLFASGAYVPLRVSGRRSENICAFARSRNGQWSLTVVPRFCTRLTPPERFPLALTWKSDTLRLPAEAPRQWRNVFTGESLEATRGGLPLSKVFATFPVAILVGARP